ncbi:hypothetical protein ACET3X_005411 [Alternaria dauci]|uniref:Uncharacterized protein n=1 Tax=Alternaria dauci TaxID=48095 RepID=A0ABR3UK72_9PLEO
MLFNNLLTLVASASVVAAFPGYPTPPKSSVGYEAPPPEEETGVCTSSTWITSSVGEYETTYLSTKTEVVPVTTVTEILSTTASPCPYTTTGASTKTVTDYTTHFNTKVYSTVTTIYNTVVESEVKSSTKCETIPVVSTGTSYKTSIATAKETITSSKTATAVITETAKKPTTYISTGTTTVCTTEDYGHY